MTNMPIPFAASKKWLDWSSPMASFMIKNAKSGNKDKKIYLFIIGRAIPKSGNNNNVKYEKIPATNIKKLFK